MLREQKGLSLRKVAGMSAISASLLSQIETGRVDPSLSTLRKIALALDVPLFHLVLETPAETSGFVKKSQRRLVVFPKDGLQYEIIHSDQQKKMGIHIGTLEPGGRTSEEPLVHSGEECLVVLAGRMKIQIGADIIELKADDSLYFDSSIPHRLYNEGKSRCIFYLIITPPKF
jgi:transcriptional regulator with XRE-family HTH domain